MHLTEFLSLRLPCSVADQAGGAETAAWLAVRLALQLASGSVRCSIEEVKRIGDPEKVLQHSGQAAQPELQLQLVVLATFFEHFVLLSFMTSSTRIFVRYERALTGGAPC